MAKEQIRLFIGVPVSMACVQELQKSVAGLVQAATDGGLDIRWVAPATYHVTVKFLGWCRREVVGAVRDQVGEVLEGQRAFEFGCAGGGTFPEPDKARVLWAGIEDADNRLGELASAIDIVTTKLGFPPDAKRFHGHVTLGRLKPAQDASGLVEKISEQKFSTTRVDGIVLYESSVKSTGSEYDQRHVWALK